MTEKKWLRDILLIPLIIGLSVAAFQFALPKLSEKNLELSYSIEDPKLQLDKTIMGNTKEKVTVEINGIETSRIISQSILFRNSGQIPIKALPIKYLYETSDTTFRMFIVTHDTKPKYEFGNINLIEETSNSKKYFYDLLNPGDEFTITFITNEEAPINVYAKAEGLNIKQIEPPTETKPYWLSLFSVLISFIAALLSFVVARKSMKLKIGEIEDIK